METATIAIANSFEEAGEFAGAIAKTYGDKYGQMCAATVKGVHMVIIEIPKGQETGFQASLALANLKGFIDGYRALKYKDDRDKIVCDATECPNHRGRGKTGCKLQTTKIIVHTGDMSKEQWQATCDDFGRE